jgi:cobalt/nickel transport system ATP-binding protein
LTSGRREHSGKEPYDHYREKGDRRRHLVRVDCIEHEYPDKTRVSICGLDFLIHEGEKVAVLGSNGSGKTTLLYHIVGLLRPSKGDVIVFDETTTSSRFEELRREIGMVFQNVDDQIIGPTVWDDIAFAPINMGLPRDEVERLVEEVLLDLKISHLRDKIPHYLSGGEKRKVAIAGAIIMRPRILILDEPFADVDPRSKVEIIELLLELNRKHSTALIFTTHDVDIVPLIADTVYVLKQGGIVLAGPAQEVFENVDVLENANIELPILAELFRGLREEGLELERTPANVAEAREYLLRLLKAGHGQSHL